MGGAGVKCFVCLRRLVSKHHGASRHDERTKVSVCSIECADRYRAAKTTVRILAPLYPDSTPAQLAQYRDPHFFTYDQSIVDLNVERGVTPRTCSHEVGWLNGGDICAGCLLGHREIEAIDRARREAAS